jgi:preprotein translocase SecE subunit
VAQNKKTGNKDEATVTRIKASDDSPTQKTSKTTTKPTVATETVAVPKKKKSIKAKSILRPFIASRDYFVGAWRELKQVRWPTRGATWSLTFAVIAYSAFFVLIVLLLDALFKYLFDLILGK